MTFQLPELGFAYDALEPHVDAKTMEIHHSKHHQAYMDKLNGYCADNGVESTIEEIIAGIDADSAPLLRNNAGGYHNHSLFWENLTAEKTEKSDALKAGMEEAFGSLEKCFEEFVAAGAGQFGSGWVWMVSDADGKISIMATPNQDSPLMSSLYGAGHRVILAIDVWEHAYYLNYQNRRPDYLAAVCNVINWDVVSQRYEA